MCVLCVCVCVCVCACFCILSLSLFFYSIISASTTHSQQYTTQFITTHLLCVFCVTFVCDFSLCCSSLSLSSLSKILLEASLLLILHLSCSGCILSCRRMSKERAKEVNRIANRDVNLLKFTTKISVCRMGNAEYIIPAEGPHFQPFRMLLAY